MRQTSSISYLYFARNRQFDRDRRLFLERERELVVALGRIVEFDQDIVARPVFAAQQPLAQLVFYAPLVLDNAAQQIFQVGEDGALTPVPLQVSFYRPRGFAVDAAGGYVVADTGGGRLVVLAADGQQVFEFGGQGSLLARGQPVDAVEANGVYWGDKLQLAMGQRAGLADARHLDHGLGQRILQVSLAHRNIEITAQAGDQRLEDAALAL